ncbi:YifB family Mg chelatase-like AAA ATPase [Burkholderia multivorans]|uniref:YifB family Mg chelatase-like AAA ATPase n=1 Tax=Burkholderia multivorans TaxID=87883 RepID=UPI00201855B5|nr:YifB family Mg chelatase-like AAA ATPase [Burkholderia multivorans]MCO1369332.1 YifB family Mg chelatase-like AAA ATPase [Burkholderia multivorans]MCO1458943.1 YifB family Mg chelatase-like AAA ATPase [Burkholderia multivorans]MCO1468393.1 YifB family Mg chelatase-like AAA ATPase [Burkholderia multivorans]UQO17448.1 YifB family Mg chelatase-like AAA ATPase [Burkholderia multivorans]UQO85172.1 YifB family Mg chelatase-like AAA ATPase [Burkholderia multivorans]
MSLAVVRSRAPAAGRAPDVTVEVHLANGLPSFSIVGLPDLEVRESRERVRAALQNCGFEFPVRRITVNLAPADLPKESGRFDLPIALGILAANGQIPVDALAGREFAGELSLTGALRPMRGAFAMACGLARDAQSGGADGDIAHDTQAGGGTAPRAAYAAAGASRTPELYLPLASAAEAALVPGVTVFGAPDLPALCAHLAGAPDSRLSPVDAPCLDGLPAPAAPDLADVVGQRAARRALEVAAAGGHHMLMVGPPGAGKSMLAARLPGLLPPLTDDEALTSAALLSASRIGFSPAQWRRRPFRSPHHSSSAAALVGGRNPPQPGEITLAHLGVLFLDELPEFDRHVLEMLREPLEAGRITISRAAQQADFPAACQLIAAMNPCPCGWLGDPSGRCRCSPDVAARYLRKLSGPLLDRIDIQIDLPALSPAELAARASTPGEPSAAVAARVAQARALQLGRQGKTNHMLSGRETDDLCRPTDEGERLLREAGERFGWSARAYYRVLKVARTIADLAGEPLPTASHIAEAIRYRRALAAL